MNKISAGSFCLVSVLYYIGNAYIVGTTASTGRDGWLCLLISGAFMIIPVLLYSSAAAHCPGQDLFMILKSRLNKKAYLAAASVYALYGVMLLGMSLSFFSRYAATAILPETPKYVLSLLFSLCVYAFVLKNGEGVGRASAIITVIVISFILMAFAVSVPFLQYDEILPLGRGRLPQEAYKTMAFPFAEPVILFSMMPDVKGGTKLRHWLAPYLFALLILVLNVMRNTMVLGSALSGMSTFPTASTDSVAGYRGFEQRLEVLTTMIPAAAGLVKATLILLFSSRALRAVFGTDKGKLCSVCALIPAFVLSLVLYGTARALDLRVLIWPFISVPLQFIAALLCFPFVKPKRSQKAKIFLRSLKKIPR